MLLGVCNGYEQHGRATPLTALSDTPLRTLNALVNVPIGHGVKLNVALNGHGV
ncbi:hypothetical protein PBI_WHIRLWIND_136 [Mycobacterium phage Whirlwind]|uniref:Uncharacterized protein n=1 Tax=Mycobacterium phage Whirlwind TaxID=1340826 RepID=S5Y531_9CAUD|nr:hypothetical protein N852_gp053 [Mycobacterium phage Whirlwind]AGT12732.1 hypothetical protein PBI_WHIRLWIND_136 [Mycobacterium phage Whirlwind]